MLLKYTVIAPWVEPLPGGGDSRAPDGDDDDGDGLSNAAEGIVGTLPNDPDTDGDGFSDLLEVILGTDPNVPGSNAPFSPVWMDFGATGPELGTELYPTTTIGDGVKQVSVSGTIKITDDSGTNNTTETPTITKALRIEAVVDPIVIGQ